MTSAELISIVKNLARIIHEVLQETKNSEEIENEEIENRIIKKFRKLLQGIE